MADARSRGLTKSVLQQSKRFLNAASNQTIISGSGVRLVVHSLMVITDNENASAAKILIGFGSGTTPDQNSSDNIFATETMGRNLAFPRNGGSAPLGEGALNQNLLFTSTFQTGTLGGINVMVTYSTYV